MKASPPLPLRSPVRTVSAGIMLRSVQAQQVLESRVPSFFDLGSGSRGMVGWDPKADRETAHQAVRARLIRESASGSGVLPNASSAAT